ncbi:hypothetical protein [Kitasatospora sp. NPDC088548]|uniref:hypothetical protein n=1 Tax=Kitasatospora sp. NPDC088548 TaxID=3364075 RepID=UPI00381562A2
MRGAIWLRWSGHDGIRTLHHGAGLARGWVEKDIDGLAGWAALVDGRLVVTRDRDGREQPVLHAEAWEAGSTSHAALAQYPAHPGDEDESGDQDEDQEHQLLGDIRTRVRRRAAGLTLAAPPRPPTRPGRAPMPRTADPPLHGPRPRRPPHPHEVFTLVSGVGTVSVTV